MHGGSWHELRDVDVESATERHHRARKEEDPKVLDKDIIKSTITSTDDGNGNYTNPVIFADVPDIDIIRVDDAFYMVSTTMHLSPGCPVMKSYDLVNWEIVNYVLIHWRTVINLP